METEPRPTDRKSWLDKLQRATEQVSKGVDAHQAISEEFGDLSAVGVERIKYYILGVLGRDTSHYTI